jgi:hypothetical protein
MRQWQGISSDGKTNGAPDTTQNRFIYLKKVSHLLAAECETQPLRQWTYSSAASPFVHIYRTWFEYKTKGCSAACVMYASNGSCQSQYLQAESRLCHRQATQMELT